MFLFSCRAFMRIREMWPSQLTSPFISIIHPGLPENGLFPRLKFARQQRQIFSEWIYN
jgi:hypothetical protein